MQLTGWKIIPVLLLLAVIVAIRITAILKEEVDPSLLRALENEIHTAKVAATVHAVKGMNMADASGDKMASMMNVVATQKPAIKSVRTTKSIFEFFTGTRDVIVEVEYSLGGVEKTEYYRFLYRPLGKSWYCIGKSTKASFYMQLF